MGKVFILIAISSLCCVCTPNPKKATRQPTKSIDHAALPQASKQTPITQAKPSKETHRLVADQMVSKDQLETLVGEVRQTGAAEFHLSRKGQNMIANNNGLVTSGRCRIVPAVDDNALPKGFKLFCRKEPMFLSRIGIKSKDVVAKVAGLNIATPDQALEVYTKLGKIQQAGKLEIEFFRNKKRHLTTLFLDK